MSEVASVVIPPFQRFEFGSRLCSRIGGGDIGGKASGLLRINDVLCNELPDRRVAGIEVSIPRFVVMGTDVFDAFIAQNDLRAVTALGLPDDQLALAFQQAELPAEFLGDLRALVEEVRVPLAVRSSSMLEDALDRPFAGIYETKMIPNNAPDPNVRFRRLLEAIKFVYASTFFGAARSYRAACRIPDDEEKMAVLLQEIVGTRHGDRFYPHVSAVCRSYSYYPIGGAAPEDGFASLALGLGKTIVDGGVCWTYSPRFPRKPPPFASVRAMLQLTQSRFWAVAMGGVATYDPIAETEYLLDCDLDAAEYDDVLRWVASTYDAASDRLRAGTSSEGARVLDFAPLLKLNQVHLNDAVRALLTAARSAVGNDVEIEFAMVLPASGQDEPRIGVLQARPMMASLDVVDLDTLEDSGSTLLSSTRALGNGVIDNVCDVVYVRPESFEMAMTPRIAAELSQINARLLAARRPYLLIGFGRWGSADPWLGIPVKWGDVSGARAIVETTATGINVDPSEGSHFFHNLSSLRVQYFTAHAEAIDWAFLGNVPAEQESAQIRHVRLREPLMMAVDGRSGHGVVKIGALPSSDACAT